MAQDAGRRSGLKTMSSRGTAPHRPPEMVTHVAIEPSPLSPPGSIDGVARGHTSLAFPWPRRPTQPLTPPQVLEGGLSGRTGRSAGLRSRHLQSDLFFERRLIRMRPKHVREYIDAGAALSERAAHRLHSTQLINSPRGRRTGETCGNDPSQESGDRRPRHSSLSITMRMLIR